MRVCCGSRFDHRGQIRAVVPRTASRGLRQQELLIQIRHDHPLQPVPPRQGFLPVMMQAPHKERADRSLRQARRVDGHASPPPAGARAAQPAHRLADRPVDGLVVQTLQETIQRREVGHAHQPQHLAQFAMLAQPHLGFAKGPVLVTHQTENGQQLRLSELVLAETASVAREHRPADLQGDAGKRQESNFGHRASCLHRKPQSRPIALPNFKEVARMSTEPGHLSVPYAPSVQFILSRGPNTVLVFAFGLLEPLHNPRTRLGGCCVPCWEVLFGEASSGLVPYPESKPAPRDTLVPRKFVQSGIEVNGWKMDL